MASGWNPGGRSDKFLVRVTPGKEGRLGSVDIATYLDERMHRRFTGELRALGFNEPISRYEELNNEERGEIRVLFGWDIDQSVVDACPALEWIQGAGAGVDWLAPVRLPQQVTVTRIIDRFGPDMGEFALLSVLAWVKDYRRIYQQQVRKEWGRYLVGSMAGLTVGVLGAGSIGSHIASVFKPLVREVRALGRRRPEVDGVRGFSSQEWTSFYTELDVLIMVLPHTPDTHRSVGKEQFALMRPGGFLVNLGRGPILDEDEFVAAIRLGQLSGGALDVFSLEPLPAESSLWELPGVTVTPHISGPSRADGMAAVFLENLSRFRAGRPLLGVVDWKRGY